MSALRSLVHRVRRAAKLARRSLANLSPQELRRKARRRMRRFTCECRACSSGDHC